MRRGDIVTVSAPGDYGKPRPAVVIQSDWLNTTESVLLCLMTSDMRDASFHRVRVDATTDTGLRQACQIMVDKIVALRRDKCGPPIGRLDHPTIIVLNRTIALVTGIAD